jgi:3-isopropylmalate/(R)-2-methylmalate dehydratase large subunit
MGKTIAEKIFAAHLRDEPFPGTYVLDLDRVLCHEITTPVAIADLVWRKKDRVFDPTRIKAVIDHVTPAKDSKTAIQGKILREWARRHDIKDFFDVGRNGVCHALFPEQGFIRPGFTVIMGDSHTCTHGAFGAFAAGVGTTDLEVGILKGVCAFRKPASILVNLQGALPRGVYSKDVILHIISILGVNGATDRVIEFRGPVVDAMSMDARMTLTNMAIEAGGTCGICLPDQTTVEYLWPFIKDDYANQAAALEDFQRWHSDADAVYERVLDLDVSNLEPQVTYDYKPDCVKPVGELAGTRIDQVYIGTCTNGRSGGFAPGGRNSQGAHHCPDGARHPVAGNAENFPGGFGRGTDCHFHGCRVLCHQSDLRRLSRHELRGVGTR